MYVYVYINQCITIRQNDKQRDKPPREAFNNNAPPPPKIGEKGRNMWEVYYVLFLKFYLITCVCVCVCVCVYTRSTLTQCKVQILNYESGKRNIFLYLKH